MTLFFEVIPLSQQQTFIYIEKKAIRITNFSDFYDHTNLPYIFIKLEIIIFSVY